MESWKSAEKEFETFFDRYGKNAWVFRLTDTAAAKATSGKKAFVQAQPSDYIVVCQGDTFFAEVKSSGEKVSFPHSNIQKRQLAAARRVLKAGGQYMFFIKSLFFGKWFLVPAQVIISSSKKSTRWSEIAKYEWNPDEIPGPDGGPRDHRDAA